MTFNKNIKVFKKKDFLTFFDNEKKYKKLINQKKILLFKKVYNKEIKLIWSRINKIKKERSFFRRAKYNCKDISINNKNNPNSIKKGYYKKFIFFPWNKSNFEIFNHFNLILKVMLKLNKKSLLKNDKIFYNNKNSAMMMVQIYQKNKGFFQLHKDSDYTNINFKIDISKKKLSKKENSGLVFYFKDDPVYLDKITSPGDVTIINSKVSHEVKKSITNEKTSLFVTNTNLI